jgi:hypothetical protein
MTARRWASSTSRGPLAPRVCRVASPRMARIANVCLQPRRSAPPVHRRTSVPRRSTKRTPAAVPTPADAETVARWRRRRRRPPPVGRRRPSCARRWSPHTRPTRRRWQKHAPTARRCARLPWPGADRHGTHSPAAATNKPDATTVCAVHRPPAQPCPCQCQRPGPEGSASVAPPVCLAHAAQSPVAAALHSPDTVRGTARHGTAGAAPKSRDRSGFAAAQRPPSVVRVPVCVCVGGFSMQDTRGRGHSRRCLLLSLCLSACVCAKERDRQSQCAFSVVALGPAPLRPRPCACVVPGTVPGRALCVCLGA